METLFVTQAEVPALLPMAECVEVMAATMKALARGETMLPLRSILWLPERVGALGLMPGALLSERRPGAEGDHVLHRKRRHALRLPPGRGAALRGGAREPARRHRRDVDHGHPHGRRQRRRDAGASRARTPATSRSSAPACRRARTSRRCAACGRSAGSASRAAASTNAQAFAERESARGGIPIEAVAAPSTRRSRAPT